MLVGGCDVGSATGKAVIMRNHEIISYEIIPSTTKPELTARTVGYGFEEGQPIIDLRA